MKESEFDRFADEYRSSHAANISASGETPEFFAEYKIADTKRHVMTENINADSVLDFGCGVGNSTAYFHKYFPDSSIVGADVSSKSLDIAKARFGEFANFVNIEGTSTGLPDASFDLIFSSCVFHHIPHAEHEHWLRELHRIARPNARLVIFEHNPLNPLTVRAVNTCEFDENAHLLAAGQLAASMRRAGWRKTRREYRIFFPRRLAALRPLEAWLRWLPLGAQYSVIARA